MIVLDTTNIPNSDDKMHLVKSGEDFQMWVGDDLLMSSNQTASEQLLATLGLRGCRSSQPRSVLIGGLGMGYTLKSALAGARALDSITVAELVPSVVAWNGGPLGALNGHPLADERVTVHHGSVVELIMPERWDCILLDVDNGPKPITAPRNAWLYSPTGVESLYDALKPNGCLAVWSAWVDDSFLKFMEQVGFRVEQQDKIFIGAK